MTISVIGLGKLGSPFLAVAASRNFNVIGVDINPKVIEKLNSGTSHICEPELLGLIKENGNRIKATLDTEEAVSNSEITFIVTATPSLKGGDFSLEFVSNVAKNIGLALKSKDTYHLIVLVSTVMPGSTEKMGKIIEEYSGKKCGEDFGLCYNPEFIALGSVVKDLLNPDFILIGESDKKSGDSLCNFYKQFHQKDLKFARMNFANAELTKISVNTYVTTKISYANMLTEICEKMPGGNVDVVTEALGMDSRIGNKYLKGGLGFGGPCFPRDNVAFISLAKKLHAGSILAESTHDTNKRQILRLTEKVIQNLAEKNKVGILGVAYKPNTDVIEESQGFLLAEELIKRKVAVNIYDPLALKNVKKILGEKVYFTQDPEECIKKSDLIILGLPDEQFKNLESSFGTERKVLIDPWRIVETKSLPDNVKYVPFGINSEYKMDYEYKVEEHKESQILTDNFFYDRSIVSQKTSMDWKNKKVLITGGSSFIGSHLLESLLKKGANVRVADNLSAGKLENILPHLQGDSYFEFIKGDLREQDVAKRAVEGVDVIFHLAADHGGRGYVDLHQAGPASNNFLSGLVFWEAVKAGVEKIVFASSGCVYPNYIQTDVSKELYLTEDMVGAPFDPDNEYGWEKLTSERVLRAYAKEFGIKTASCRYFTVYGPRGKEDHAVIAFIARAFIGQNPFEVWGDGQQIRNWTYVEDIIEGTILAAEKIDDGSAVNLGTMERIRVIDAVKEVLNYTGLDKKIQIKFRPDMPTGPVNRVADNSLAKRLLGWEPQIKFVDGLHKTIDWYFSTKKKEEVKKTFEHMLTER